jgi:hypothetical protein
MPPTAMSKWLPACSSSNDPQRRSRNRSNQHTSEQFEAVCMCDEKGGVHDSTWSAAELSGGCMSTLTADPGPGRPASCRR